MPSAWEGLSLPRCIWRQSNLSPLPTTVYLWIGFTECLLWNIDLTVVPVDGSWVSWEPFAFSPTWPFFWWVAVIMDHFSRVIVGFALFRREPTAEEMTQVLALAIRKSR